VALEAEADAVRLVTPELPDTRSEAALPLRSRGRVLGALSVQHSEAGVFDADTMSVLQTMADQVAVALDNARLFAESQSSFDAIQRAYGQLSREAWEELLESRGEWGYRYTRAASGGIAARAGGTVAPVSGAWHPEMLEARRTGRTVGFTRVGAGNGGPDDGSQGAAAQAPDGNGASGMLAIPLKVRDQVIGALRFSKGPEGEDWTEEERALLEAFAAQLEMALDSARLYQDTQRRAAQEQLVGQVTARMRESLDVEKVLKTASEELYQALGLEELVISLNPVSGTTAEFGNGSSE
jgi:GAF domain-containing protein